MSEKASAPHVARTDDARAGPADLRTAGWVLLAAALLVAGDVLYVGWPEVLDTSAPDPRLAPLFLAAIATLAALGMLARGFLRQARYRRDGDSRLEAGTPRIGATFAGRIFTTRDLPARGDCRIALRCERSSRPPDAKGATRRQADCLWERIVAVPPGATSSAGVPFAFEIPADGLRTGAHGEGEYTTHVYWTLEMRAPMAGVGYLARFPIPMAGGRKDSKEGKAFAGSRRPLSSWQKVAFPGLLGLGSLLLAAGLYTTSMQVLLDFEGLSASGRIVERERSAVQVALDGNGATVRVPIGSNAHRWSTGQAVSLRCRELGAAPRGCQMDTGGERWIGSLGTLFLGLAMLGAAAWIWRSRTRVSAG